MVVVVVEVVVEGVLPSEAATMNAVNAMKAKVVMDDTASLIMCLSLCVFVCVCVIQMMKNTTKVSSVLQQEMLIECNVPFCCE